jgi:hypothetical protein
LVDKVTGNKEGKLRRAAARALADRLSELGRTVDAAGYVRSPDEALVDGLSPDARSAIVTDLTGKGGSELLPRGGSPPKFHAAHSSACLAANTFGPFLGPGAKVSIGNTEIEGFASLEHECPSGLRGTPPTLDLLVENDDEVVAVESKCTEMLHRHVARFSDAYGAEAEKMGPGWRSEYEVLRDDPERYRFLDAAQLIKHQLGLLHTFPGRRLTLIYLYWTPANADELAPCRQHEEEARAFAQRVDGDDRVRFLPMTYRTLWEQWVSRGGALADHANELMGRYLIEV